MPLKYVDISWRRLIYLCHSSMTLQLHFFSLLSLLEYYFASELKALTKICTGGFEFVGVDFEAVGLWWSHSIFDVWSFLGFLYSNENNKSLRTPSLEEGLSGHRERWSRPQPRRKIVLLSCGVPVSISALDALLQPLPFFINSRKISVFPWSFHRTSQEHLASLFLATQSC